MSELAERQRLLLMQPCQGRHQDVRSLVSPSSAPPDRCSHVRFRSFGFSFHWFQVIWFKVFSL